MVECLNPFYFSLDVNRTTPTTTKICMYAKFNDVRSCLILFEMGDKWNVSLWNAVMFMFVRSGNSRNAVDAFRQLVHIGVEADYISFLSVTSAASQLTDMNLSSSSHASVAVRGLDRDPTTASALMDMHARSGNLSAAGKLFDCLVEKDNVSWNVMINAQGLHGNTEEALALLSRMEDSGFGPDSITYLSVLSSCRHSGSVDEASDVFRFMIRKRNNSKGGTLSLLGGHLSDALAMIAGLPHAVSPSTLKSLLGAYYTQSNVELAEEVSKMLSETDTGKSLLPHLMLRHTYMQLLEDGLMQIA